MYLSSLFAINWSALIVFFAIGLLGLWVSYSFLNKKGLYLFAALASFVSITCCSVSMFSNTFSIGLVLMPLVYLAILTGYKKFGKQGAYKLLILVGIVLAVGFITNFLQSAYLDVLLEGQVFLAWGNLGKPFAGIVAFVLAVLLTILIAEKVTALNKIKGFWKTSTVLAIACVIDNIISVIFGGLGVLSFGNMLLVLLISIVISLAICVLLGYFERFLNRQLVVKTVEAKKEENLEVKEENKEESKKTEKEEVSSEKKENKKTKENVEKEEEINYDSSAD